MEHRIIEKQDSNGTSIFIIEYKILCFWIRKQYQCPRAGMLYFTSLKEARDYIKYKPSTNYKIHSIEDSK